jgi:hypothetical protein
MSLAIGDIIDETATTILRSNVARRIAENPLYTALVIVFIIVLVVMFVFRDVDTGDDNGLLFLSIRTGFWAFFVVTALVFLNNKVLMATSSDTAYSGAYDDEPAAVAYAPVATTVDTADEGEITLEDILEQ